MIHLVADNILLPWSQRPCALRHDHFESIVIPINRHGIITPGRQLRLCPVRADLKDLYAVKVILRNSRRVFLNAQVIRNLDVMLRIGSLRR